MARKNIFEILEEKWNIIDEVKRIYNLLNEYCINIRYLGKKTVIEFVNEYCFYEWKNRGSYLNISDMADELEIELDENDIPDSLTIIEILKYLEFAENLIMLCDIKIFEDNTKNDRDLYEYTYYQEYSALKENINIVLEHLNYCSKKFEDDEKVILVEKSTPAIAVAEIMDKDTGYKVLEYNHFLLEGDIDRKKEILLQLGNKYEAIKNKIKESNNKLYDNINFMLNNMNIRHNNKKGKNKKEYVSKMRKSTLEKWYDETYQMLLLAFLLDEQIKRNVKIKNLKEKFE